MGIQVYNTLTRKKEPFQTLEPGKVKMYVCGPTVYNYFHIGNARPFTFFDTMRRYLEYRGYEVQYVQNFTDVDDKIIGRGHEEGISPLEVAEKYIQAYYEDAEGLNIRKADIHPRVTGDMPEIIQMIESLVEQGHAYAADGDVYFDTTTYEDYGKLSKQTIENLQAGVRVEVSEKKKHEIDFALWKAAKPGEIFWESPWGPGRPGWHIECSAMNLKYLGERIDIHGGGVDLIFPHHENELAQSEACNHEPFATYWVHTEFVNLNNEKMSKSTGNFLTTRDLLGQHDGAVLRYLLLSTHYSKPLNFSEELIHNAQAGLDRIRTSKANLEHRLAGATDGHTDNVDAQSYRAKFREQMDDDFNTADAITVIFDVVRDANTYLRGETVERQAVEAYLQLIVELMDVLGLSFAFAAAEANDDAQIDQLIAERTAARQAKNWARADEIRDQLTALNIVIEDTPQGIRWRRK